jgi:hypothetical protein
MDDRTELMAEEILPRFPEINVVNEPARVRNAFIRGYAQLPVMIPRRL